MSLLLFVLARRAKPEVASKTQAAAETGAAKTAASGAPAGDSLDSVLKLDELMLEVGLGLVPLVDSKQGGQLLGKVRSLRKQLASQLGFLIPSIHITDNLSLKEFEYVIHLRGAEIARWEMRRNCLLAISSQPNPPALPGGNAEPAFNTPAKWIQPDIQAQAVAARYVVVDHTSALATHIGEVVKQNAHLLLTRQETKRLIDRNAETHPDLLRNLFPRFSRWGKSRKFFSRCFVSRSRFAISAPFWRRWSTSLPLTRIQFFWWRRSATR